MPSYGAAFAPDGRLATTALDGKVRLYGRRSARATVRPWSRSPHPAAASPSGLRSARWDTRRNRLNDGTAVTLLDGHTLALLPGPDLTASTMAISRKVAWSRDGGTLFAAGRNARPVTQWFSPGAMPAQAPGAHVCQPEHRDEPRSAAHGDLLVAAGDPWLARLQADGSASWAHGPPQADFRNQFDQLRRLERWHA